MFRLCYLLLSGYILSVNCMPSPQEGDVSLDDILNAAGNDSTRYGTDPGNINQSLLDDVFGSSNKDTGASNAQATPTDYDYYEDVDVGDPTVETDSLFNNCSYYEEEGYGYECVPYYNCKNGTIITDGGGLFDIRSGLLDPLASKCPSYLEVCCRHEDYSDDPLPTLPPPVIVEPSTNKPPVIVEPSPNKPPVITEPPVQPTVKPPNSCPGPSCPYRQRCGQRNIGGIGVRIQNIDKFSGSTQFGEWPHMCAILNKGQVGGKEVNLYVCGGSLIAPGVVLTGAHCVNDIKNNFANLKVRCGEWDTQQQIEPQKHVDKKAKHVSVHPTFDEKSLRNDFALIHLEEEFILDAHINTMCLPDPYEDEISYVGRNCFATGWGKDKFGNDGDYQVILKQVQMDIVDHGLCDRTFKNSRLGKHFHLHDSFVCAGGEPGKDTCKGDGGGPLVCPATTAAGTGTQYIQAGIVAWGIGCGSETPGVYADVSNGLRFIDWATKCVDGPDADYYGFGWDDRWAKREYCGYQNRTSTLAVKMIPETQALVRSTKNRTEKKDLRKTLRGFRNELKRLRKEFPLYQSAISSCTTGKQDYDCSINDFEEYDVRDVDIDLSTFAREKDGKAEEGNGGGVTVGPRLGATPVVE